MEMLKRTAVDYCLCPRCTVIIIEADTVFTNQSNLNQDSYRQFFLMYNSLHCLQENTVFRFPQEANVSVLLPQRTEQCGQTLLLVPTLRDALQEGVPIVQHEAILKIQLQRCSDVLKFRIEETGPQKHA